MQNSPQNEKASKFMGWVFVVSIAAIVLAISFRVIRWVAGF